MPSTLPGIRDKKARAAPEGAIDRIRYYSILTLTTDGTSLIILSLVSSNIRSCTLPSSKLKSLDLMLFLSCYLTDEAKLDRLIPYVVDLLHDDAAVVRAAAVRAILQVVCASHILVNFWRHGDSHSSSVSSRQSPLRMHR